MMPGLHFKCLDCGHIFPASAAAQRPSELEDGCAPWVNIDICPECKSDQLQELERCEICGNPVGDDSDFCMGCQFIIDEAFKEAIGSIRRQVNPPRPMKSGDLISLIFDRAEEQGFYSFLADE